MFVFVRGGESEVGWEGGEHVHTCIHRMGERNEHSRVSGSHNFSGGVSVQARREREERVDSRGRRVRPVREGRVHGVACLL